jgi:hypothetical protein
LALFSSSDADHIISGGERLWNTEKDSSRVLRDCCWCRCQISSCKFWKYGPCGAFRQEFCRLRHRMIWFNWLPTVGRVISNCLKEDRTCSGA